LTELTINFDSTITSQAERMLRGMIMDGTIPSGAHLNEAKLATSLGISRGPIREAIQRLTRDGLLVSISHRGTFVRKFDRQEVEELYELRRGLETFAIGLAAERATVKGIAEVEAALARTEASTDGPIVRYSLELDFHLALIRLAQNEALTRVAADAHRQLSLARLMTHSSQRAELAFHEHRALLDAVASHDPELAIDLTVKHLERSKTNALMLLDQARLTAAEAERSQ